MYVYNYVIKIIMFALFFIVIKLFIKVNKKNCATTLNLNVIKK